MPSLSRARAGKRRPLVGDPAAGPPSRPVRLHGARRRPPGTRGVGRRGVVRHCREDTTSRPCQLCGRSHGRSPADTTDAETIPRTVRTSRISHAWLRTRFRPLHGNFNPIRNIFRAAGQAASGKRGTTARGENSWAANRNRTRGCAKRRMLRAVCATLRGGFTGWSTADLTAGPRRVVLSGVGLAPHRCTPTISRPVRVRRDERRREVRFAVSRSPWYAAGGGNAAESGRGRAFQRALPGVHERTPRFACPPDRRFRSPPPPPAIESGLLTD